MKKKIYWRRKKDKIVAEGQETKYGKRKTIFLFTLPDPDKLLIPSLFTPEKLAKIQQKICRLDSDSKSEPDQA